MCKLINSSVFQGSDEGTGDAIKAATDLAKYVKLQSEEKDELKNQTITKIIIAITKVTVERPVVIMYRREKGKLYASSLPPPPR